MRIAIDVMGGDHGPEAVMPAAFRCIREFNELNLILVGDAELIRPHVVKAGTERIQIHHASQVVEMTDKPSIALRQKKDSSMHLAIDLVRKGEADACISSGNTGALMAIGRHLLKTLPGIDRPAIIKAIPSARGKCYLLDLGANINCDAENLMQFAAMGSLMCEAVEGIESPRVGLLNIGEEEIKGEDQVKVAAEVLKRNSLINFIGYVEGDGIYMSDADVLVCDGWVGNVALKTSEGLARFFRQMINQAFERNMATRLAGVFAKPVLKRLHQQLEPEQYNGATLLGLAGTVIKSHGNATPAGIYQAIVEAIKAVEQDVPTLIRTRIDSILSACD